MHLCQVEPSDAIPRRSGRNAGIPFLKVRSGGVQFRQGYPFNAVLFGHVLISLMFRNVPRALGLLAVLRFYCISDVSIRLMILAVISGWDQPQILWVIGRFLLRCVILRRNSSLNAGFLTPASSNLGRNTDAFAGW
jgi:hypothetical protein